MNRALLTIILTFALTLTMAMAGEEVTSSATLLEAFDELPQEQQEYLLEALDQVELTKADLSDVVLEMTKTNASEIRSDLYLTPTAIQDKTLQQKSFLIKLGVGFLLPYGPEISASIGSYDWGKNRYRYSIFLSYSASIPQFKSNVNVGTVGVNFPIVKGLYLGPVFKYLMVHQGLLIGQQNFYLTSFGGNVGYRIPLTLAKFNLDVDLNGYVVVGGLDKKPQGFTQYGLGVRVNIPYKKKAHHE